MVFTSTSKLLSIVTQTFLHVANFPPLQTIFLTPPPPIFKIHTPSPRILLRTTFYDSPIYNRNNFSSCTFFLENFCQKTKTIHLNELQNKKKIKKDKSYSLFQIKILFSNHCPPPFDFWLKFSRTKIKATVWIVVEARTICGRFGAIIKNFDSNVYSGGVLNQRRGKKKNKSVFVVVFFPMGYCNFKNPSIRSNPSLFCDVLFWFWILSFYILGNFARHYHVSISVCFFFFFFSRFFALSRATDIYFGSTQSVLQLLHSSTLGVSHSLCNYLIQQRPV